MDYKKVQTYLGHEFSKLFGENLYPEYKTQIDSDYKKFKTSTNKTVNYLVKEFELKKNEEGILNLNHYSPFFVSFI